MSRISRRSLWLVVALAVGGGVLFALRSRAVPVTVVSIAPGDLTETIVAEGRSRIRDLFVVTAPVAGDLERLELEAGDSVPAGAIVARIGPLSSQPLDPRSRAVADAAVGAARAALRAAEARAGEAEAAGVHADAELENQRRRLAIGGVPPVAVEQAEHEADIRRQGAEAARAAVEVARSELTRAEAQLGTGTGGEGGSATLVRAPAGGRILRIVRQSGGPVAVGEPLLELGNLPTLEFFADLLTTEAMSVPPGAEAEILDWGGAAPIPARVRRVEPGAFTKISPLGVEEQRVRVILDPIDDAPAGLGNDFQVVVSIAIWKGVGVLTVPTTSLVRSGQSWAVFVVEDGRARLRTVTTGPSDAERTVIERGVRDGDQVVAQPSDAIADGVRVLGSGLAP